MAIHPYTWRGIWNAAITGFCIIAVACALQAAFAPTVRLSCPTRTSASPDCELRWLVAFDTIPIRRTPLPALESAGEIEATSNKRSSSRSVTPFTVYLQTATGRVRTILWGDHIELQRFREPIVKYLKDVHASPLEVTMSPSTHPWRMIASGIVCVGLLFWVWLPVQIAVVFSRSVKGA